MPMTIVVHGGAGTIAPERRELAQEGCREAAALGWRLLQEGRSALDAVEAAVRLLEDNPNYNAGTGSTLSADGSIEMDAGLMEGHTLQIGAVAGVELIKNPIALARLVLESPYMLLIGKGAQSFALEHGMALCTREDLLTERQYRSWLAGQLSKLVGEADEPPIHRREVASFSSERGRKREPTEPAVQSQEPQASPEKEGEARYEQEEKHGTVGAVALDAFGNLAAATSTGGVPNKYPGRVGDSPLPGCGFYADDRAAISCTGHGEDFIRLLLAKRAADFVARGSTAREAAEAAIALLGAKTAGIGGLIIVDRVGNVGFAWNSENMSRAYITQDMQEPISGV